MYKPQHTRRQTAETSSDDDDNSTDFKTATTSCPPPINGVRRRSTVDTPYHLDSALAAAAGNTPHSQSEPRKSWAETDWEELEKLWSLRENTLNSSHSDRLEELKNTTAVDVDGRDSGGCTATGGWRGEDLFLQFFQNHGSKPHDSVGDGAEEVEDGIVEVKHNVQKTWRRRITI